jgi:putative hydrolase of the HAD superfamily
MSQPTIRNIVFDLGNVIIDLDIDRTWQSLQHYLGTGYLSRLEAAYPTGDIFIDFEIGKISETVFFETLQTVAAYPLSIRQLKEAWNAMLLGINPARFDMLLRLKQDYTVCLLSNTNETHLDFVDGYLRTVYGFDINHFEKHYFHHAFYSHKLHLRKPNVAIYAAMLEQAQLKATETLFIDDMPANTEGAKKAGLQTYLHTVGAEIVDVMADFSF